MSIESLLLVQIRLAALRSVLTDVSKVPKLVLAEFHATLDELHRAGVHAEHLRFSGPSSVLLPWGSLSSAHRLILLARVDSLLAFIAHAAASPARAIGFHASEISPSNENAESAVEELGR